MTLITAAVTLVAAFLFGLSTVLEQRSTKEVPERGPLSLRLLADLARRPLWLAALVLQVSGNVLQIVALHIGGLKAPPQERCQLRD